MKRTQTSKIQQFRTFLILEKSGARITYIIKNKKFLEQV